MDKSNLTGMVLLDLQKAFDTVDRGVLLMKLEATGLDADGLRWFQSYLSGRTQLVDVHGTCSSFANVTCGVPQGSILGPLLFLIYVNDMAGAINEKILFMRTIQLFRSLINMLMQLKQDLELPLKLLVSGSLIINCLYTLVRLSLLCLGRNGNSQTVEI